MIAATSIYVVIPPSKDSPMRIQQLFVEHETENEILLKDSHAGLRYAKRLRKHDPRYGFTPESALRRFIDICKRACEDSEAAMTRHLELAVEAEKMLQQMNAKEDGDAGNQ